MIVTGATGHLGTAICKALLSAGDTVVAVYRRNEALQSLRDGLRAPVDKVVFEKADVARAGEMDRVIANVVQHFGRVDVLVNTVGGYMTGAVQDTAVEEFDRAFDLNLKSMFLSCKAVIAPMRSQSLGTIVNVASRSALHGDKDQFLYSASKAGVLRLTESLAEELKDSGVRVNAIVPKILDTLENRAMMPKAKWDRWPSPDQVARVVVWLCSEGSEVVSGAAIPVYGRS